VAAALLTITLARSSFACDADAVVTGATGAIGVRSVRPPAAMFVGGIGGKLVAVPADRLH
jgi:hypothetical protein